MSEHTANLKWTRDDAVFTDGKYSRAHMINFDGGASIAGSSAPEVVRPPLSKVDAADPEELLVAALSSCHMLFFLDLARRAKLVVDSYEDDPLGVLGKLPSGQTGFVKITLRPRVTFDGESPSAEQLADLHHKAHDYCYIANSLSCEVAIDV